MPLLSVLMPVYNESRTVRQIVDNINAVPIDKEIIAVDDGSTDGSGVILREIGCSNLKVIQHTRNRGKGAAVLTALSYASGEYVILQDADLEYDPNEYINLMNAIINKGFDLALGARFTEGYKGAMIPRAGNRFLTTLFDLLFGVRLNDCFTCYKLTRKANFSDLALKCKSFDIEIEILSKAIKKGLRITEVPIKYSPRTYQNGKKIRIIDGVWAVFYMIKLKFIS